MPKATTGSVLLGAARRDDHCRKDDDDGYVSIQFIHYPAIPLRIYLLLKTKEGRFYCIFVVREEGI
jgi:hypothetical protein